MTDFNAVDSVEDSNTSNNPHFSEILRAQLDRRTIIRGGAGLTAAMMMGGSLTGCSDNDDDKKTSSAVITPLSPVPGVTPAAAKTINFAPVPHSQQDAVIVPEGYKVSAFLPVGDSLVSAFADWNDTVDFSGESYQFRVGDNHDGLWFFGYKNGQYDPRVSDRGLLVINHEYVEAKRLSTSGGAAVADAAAEDPIYATRKNADDVRREVNSHGVGIYEVVRNADNTFSLVKDSLYNRRITSATVVDISGPAAGNNLLKTKFDPTGTTTRGINNQCGSGPSPWGTYLTVEENFNGAFARRSTDTGVSAERATALARYGVGTNRSGRYKWESPFASDAQIVDEFARWDISSIGTSATDDYRNAFHTFGYITEIDPFDLTSRPVKRTALGRFAHENCGYAPVKKGEPVVLYMGDDATGEYMYKFVSKAVWDPQDANGGLAAGDKYLDEGTLYVAKFLANPGNPTGKGEWVELTYGVNGLTSESTVYPFSSQAEVLVFARLAADAVGATKMDRPEWVNASPVTGEVYLTLTNNTSNRHDNADAANPRDYNDRGNVNGHVIRWRETGNDHTATTFAWDIFVFGAPYDADADTVNISGLTADNDLSSPDGLMFDPRGVLWIQTDDGAYLSRTNCMMLVALPGSVGDGSEQSVNGVMSHIGAQPTADNFARFLTGPKEAEITGVAYTPDMKTLFVSIQHPGERGSRAAGSYPGDGYNSHWPASQTDAASRALPRSALAVIVREDGGVILGE